MMLVSPKGKPMKAEGEFPDTTTAETKAIKKAHAEAAKEYFKLADAKGEELNKVTAEVMEENLVPMPKELIALKAKL